MKMLIVGAGVIGTVYGAHVAAAGSKVSVLSHGSRTGEVAAAGLSARDVLRGRRVDAEADVVPDACGDYDVVLVAVRRDQLASACAELAVLTGKPAVVFFGNNPAGRAAIPGDVPGEVYLGFPGVGGVMTGGIADYVLIRQQPTPEASDPRLAALESALSGRGSRSSGSPTWMDGLPTTPRSSRASRRPSTGAEPTPSVSPRTARTSRSCAGPLPEHSPPCARTVRQGSRVTSLCFTARCSGRLLSVIGPGPCARRRASCALPRTRGTPRRRCGPWAAEAEPPGSRAALPWRSCSARSRTSYDTPTCIASRPGLAGMGTSLAGSCRSMASAPRRSGQMVKLRSRPVRRSSFATGRLGAAEAHDDAEQSGAALCADQHG